MLDNFIFAKHFFCRVSDCKLVDKVARSNNSSVQVKLKIFVIKFKVKVNVKVKVDWTTIGENVEKNDLFNVNMFQLLPKDTTYIQLNHFITQAAGMTAVTTKRGNKVWFHHILEILLLLIETRNEILTKYLTVWIGKGDTSFTKKKTQLSTTWSQWFHCYFRVWLVNLPS